MTLSSVPTLARRPTLARAAIGLVIAAGASTVMLAPLPGLAQSQPTATSGAMTDLVVRFDHSHLLELSRPASEVIVGNPVIADVQVQSGTTLIVTGKTFGVTNLIILDAERKKIAEHRVMVVRDDARSVTLWRSTARQSYNCAPGQPCNPSLVIGDDEKYFGRVQSAAKGKIGFSASGIESGNAGNLGNGPSGGPGGPASGELPAQ
jgi:hypothetical protein